MSTFTPTPHQRLAIDAVERELAAGHDAALIGYAGTGKSALASEYFSRTLDAPLFLAPTNRACFVLRSKLPEEVKVRVLTIHAAAMKLQEETHDDAIKLWEALTRAEGQSERCAWAHQQWKARVRSDRKANREELKQALQVLDTYEGDALVSAIARNLRRCRQANELVFRRPDREGGFVARTLVVDEASMVSMEMHQRLKEAFPSTPILFIGDPAQLPPIVGEYEEPGSVLDHMEPTAELTEVLRQQGDDSDDSPVRIALMANHIRSQTAAPFPNQWAGKVDTKSLKIMTRPKSKLTAGLLDQAAAIVRDDGIVLCWRNDTRRSFNRKLRQRMKIEPTDGRPAWLPVAGERMIVAGAPGVEDPVTGKEPSPECTLTKGEPFTLSADAELIGDGKYDWVRLSSDTPGFGPDPLHVPAEPFLNTYQESAGGRFAFPRKNWFVIDYGMAATVHKSQGSQYKNVLFYEQHPWKPPVKGPDGRDQFERPDPEEHRRFLYTGITRATHYLLLVCEPSKVRGWR